MHQKARKGYRGIMHQERRKAKDGGDRQHVAEEAKLLPTASRPWAVGSPRV